MSALFPGIPNNPFGTLGRNYFRVSPQSLVAHVNLFPHVWVSLIGTYTNIDGVEIGVVVLTEAALNAIWERFRGKGKGLRVGMEAHYPLSELQTYDKFKDTCRQVYEQEISKQRALQTQPETEVISSSCLKPNAKDTAGDTTT